jgi:aromatic-L-amino-acid decarboxylase
MNSEEFRQNAHQFVDWMADYLKDVETYPVKSQVRPKEIYNRIGDHFPVKGESIESIFEDFAKDLLPGITHWQSPNFYAYFNANSSPPSVLAEMLTATLGVQGMKWDTSPASTELEQRTMEWLRDAMAIPQGWIGVIQDTASSATLAAIISAREKMTNFDTNQNGVYAYSKLRIYCSEETHSSIEKGVKIAGLGKENIIKIKSDHLLQMDASELEKCIEEDKKNGHLPCCIISTVGTTGTTAIDPIERISAISERHNVWHHIDAAYLGSALLLPEYQHLIKGIEKADSFVFNPHKWMFTNFDCSVYFVKDKEALIQTFSILPEYLKTRNDNDVDNHCDWGIPLGRRFRSLKLWFVMRYYGLEEIQSKLRSHISMAEWLEEQVKASSDFHMIIPRTMNLVCFHFNPELSKNIDEVNKLNEDLLDQINSIGNIYLTHTKVEGKYTLRMVIGQTNVTMEHIREAWRHIQDVSNELISRNN